MVDGNLFFSILFSFVVFLRRIKSKNPQNSFLRRIKNGTAFLLPNTVGLVSSGIRYMFYIHSSYICKATPFKYTLRLLGFEDFTCLNNKRTITNRTIVENWDARYYGFIRTIEMKNLIRFYFISFIILLIY